LKSWGDAAQRETTIRTARRPSNKGPQHGRPTLEVDVEFVQQVLKDRSDSGR
jgi:hypothetical protein